MQVLIPGHSYNLAMLDGGNTELHFIKKEELEGQLKTVANGTTNEEVLRVLIDRLQFLQGVMPCRENAIVITKLEESLMWLENRTKVRISRGVEGTHQA